MMSQRKKAHSGAEGSGTKLLMGLHRNLLSSLRTGLNGNSTSELENPVNQYYPP
jgi:hypothetical protein